MGAAWAIAVTAPAREWSPSAAMTRAASNTRPSSRNAPQSIAGSGSVLPNAVIRPSWIATRVPSAQASGAGSSSITTAGAPASASGTRAPVENAWSPHSSRKLGSPARCGSAAASDAALPSSQFGATTTSTSPPASRAALPTSFAW